MEIVNCIACEAELTIKHPINIGTQVKCPQCKAEFEVVWLDPLEIDWPFDDDYEDEEEEEYYYDYDEEEEEY